MNEEIKGKNVFLIGNDIEFQNMYRSLLEIINDPLSIPLNLIPLRDLAGNLHIGNIIFDSTIKSIARKAVQEYDAVIITEQFKDAENVSRERYLKSNREEK